MIESLSGMGWRMTSSTSSRRGTPRSFSAVSNASSQLLKQWICCKSLFQNSDSISFTWPSLYCWPWTIWIPLACDYEPEHRRLFHLSRKKTCWLYLLLDKHHTQAYTILEERRLLISPLFPAVNALMQVYHIVQCFAPFTGCDLSGVSTPTGAFWTQN